MRERIWDEMILLRISQSAQVDDVFHAGLLSDGGKSLGTILLARGVSLSAGHIVDQIIRSMNSLHRRQEG